MDDEARLSAEVRRIIAGNTLSALGTGFTLPFLLIYLTEARGLQVDTASNAIAVLGLAGLVTVPLMGWLADRVGPWRVLVGALVVEGLATALFAGVTKPWQAFAVLGLLGAGQAATWPSQAALIASLVDPARRARVFAVQFVMLNLGIGLGGAVSGLVVDESRVGTFQAIYLIDALSFGAYALLLLTIRHVGRRPPPRAPAGARSGYGDLVRDRVFLRLCLVVLLLSTAGYGQIYAGFPGFVTGEAGVSTRVLGLAFAANTVVIVATQMAVERRLQRHRRTRALALLALMWATSWAVIGSAALLGGHAASAAVIVGLAAFGLGETLWAPTGNTLVNDIAPPHLRGRYNAVSSVTWQLSAVIGPVLAGLLLEADREPEFIAGLMAVLLVVAAMALRLEHHLTPESNNERASPAPEGVAAAAGT